MDKIEILRDRELVDSGELPWAAMQNINMHVGDCYPVELCNRH